jgi:hypothetical protein
VASALSPRIRRFLLRLIGGSILVVVALALIAYVVDYGVFRYRLAKNAAYGQVTVTTYDAVLQKNGKTEFLFDPPQAETCVNALFPHAGFSPCWYLQRHPEQRINI